MADLRVIEICAGAGGQALGLEKAGFTLELAVELDPNAVNSLRHNRPHWKVVQGDVADREIWDPADYAPTVAERPVDLLAAGVPCPPFTIAGKQLGASDERDLFAWTVEQVGIIKPRALLLENVRGLSMPRFAGYRQHILDRLAAFGYVGEWRLLQASDFGVPQLRPRFILIAMKPEDFRYLHWPEPAETVPPTVGEVLYELMSANGWPGAQEWARRADQIAPTIVGGSKKHGGADLGPTRAKRAWAELGVDGHGLANEAPSSDTDVGPRGPRLTTDMVARLQGWDNDEFRWEFTGRKTPVYRQLGNAFPPPLAWAIGVAISAALRHVAEPNVAELPPAVDPIYRALRDSGEFMTADEIAAVADLPLNQSAIARYMELLARDFEIQKEQRKDTVAYRLGAFRAFTGQADHARHAFVRVQLAKVS